MASNYKQNALGLVGEFKAFIAKGNVIDLAVGIIIGAAFSDIVKALVADIITPLFGLFGGANGGMHSFQDFKLGPFAIGHFVNTVFSFLILAAVIFFLFVKPMNRLTASMTKPAAPAPPSPTPEDVLLLREIRDLLKAGPTSEAAQRPL